MSTDTKTIFLVDDDPTNLEVGSDALDECYDVLTLNSGARLLKALEKRIPDLILLDVEMPEMGGYEVIKQIKYDIHITRWHRDALGYCRKYAQGAQNETVRVHVFGGTGTLFEIVNAAPDLPNVQIAGYPMGRTNTFLHYYGLENAPLFSSLEKQIFSGVTGIDAIRCNHNYGISNVLIGFEAYVDNKLNTILEKRIPREKQRKISTENGAGKKRRRKYRRNGTLRDGEGAGSGGKSKRHYNRYDRIYNRACRIGRGH